MAALAQKTDIPVDPLGEWYEVGYQMGVEASRSFQIFKVPQSELGGRLLRVTETLGVDLQSIKTTDMKMLQKGWDDGVTGQKQAFTFSKDQRGSLVPPLLRGFHLFSDSMSPEIASRADEWKKAVVKVITGTGHGSGFFIGRGLILTNEHVITGQEFVKIELEEDHSEHEGTVIASVKNNPDVALVKIKRTDHALLKIGDSDLCKALDQVVLLGYPAYKDNSAVIVQGAISQTEAPQKAVDFFETNNLMALDVSATGGNSGGPVISLKSGEVIGLFTGENVLLPQFKFAHKINLVKDNFLNEHLENHQ